MKYLLSVDGGGTKTQFCVCDNNGRKMGQWLSGSSNYKSVGSDGIFNSFQEGIEQMQTFLGISISEIGYSVWGISGCDSEKDYKVIYDEIIKVGFLDKQVYLCNDGVLAYYAQTSGKGMVIIAGTGSIVIGTDEKGNTKRAGGWGYNISDAGSGYWIGCEALKKTLLYCDGCEAASKLYEKIAEYFNCSDMEELPYIITELTNFYQIAKLALPVVTLAEQGELLAQNILQEGADTLSDLVVQVFKRMNFSKEDRLHIVYSGGVLKNTGYQKLMTRLIKQKLSTDNLEFIVQKNEPVMGGIALAMKLYEEEVS